MNEELNKKTKEFLNYLPNMPIWDKGTMKRKCVLCGEMRSLSYYTITFKEIDGYNRICKECEKI